MNDSSFPMYFGTIQAVLGQDSGEIDEGIGLIWGGAQARAGMIWDGFRVRSGWGAGDFGGGGDFARPDPCDDKLVNYFYE